MELNEYQNKAMTTCMPTSKNPLYMLFGLQGEVGELMGKFAKLIRKDYFRFDNNEIEFTEKMQALSESELDDIEEGIKGELGDVAWLLAGTCEVLGYTLEEICKKNLDKLSSRKERHVIDGNGDFR